MASVASISSATAVKRLRREYEKMRKAPAPGISAVPRCSASGEVNWFTWDCCMVGPVDSPYEDGIFRALIEIPRYYPMMPPKMSFVTPIFHPNVYSKVYEGAMPGERHTRGEVCISILKAPGRDLFGEAPEDTRWRASLSIEAVLLSVYSLLIDPNPDSPANTDAATLWRRSRSAFLERARRNVANSLGLRGSPPAVLVDEVGALPEREYKALLESGTGAGIKARKGGGDTGLSGTASGGAGAGAAPRANLKVG